MASGRFDIAVVGGGIAGATAARGASRSHSVVLLEQENELAHHTTSRSAAIYIENEGGPIFHRLSTASKDFFHDAPGSETPLLDPMGVLSVCDESNEDVMRREVEAAQTVTPSLQFVSAVEAAELCPVLRSERITGAMYEPTAASIDVMGLHQLYVRTAIGNGAEVRRSARVTAIRSVGGGFELNTAAGTIYANIVINAAGAWGDGVAHMAGVQPVGLSPKRRTAFTAPVEVDPTGWPFVYCGIEAHKGYFKPEAGQQLLCSLADEGESEPCDARPLEIDIAHAIHNINEFTTLGIRSVRTTWAGLRTFAPDRNPVFGWDDAVPGFLWLVGQGGCGIVSSPVAGEIVSSLVRGEALPTSVTDLGLNEESLAPRR